MKDINFLKQNGVDVDKSLELFGDVEIYNETFQDYLDGIEEKKANLKKFKDLANWADYAIFAHSIKSDARYLGFTKVAEIALNHEMAGKESNQHFILDDYDNLIKATDGMTDIVKRYMNGETALVKEEIKSEEPKLNNEGKLAIIVADDSKLVNNFVKKMIDEKYEILPAYDGQEVINLINNNQNYKIECLLLDLNMPKVSGFQVLDYFQEHNLFKEIPVSIITGEDSKDMINKAFQYQIVDMLVKPFSAEDVKRVVNKTISFHEM